jgi:hypothetical protein
MRALRSWLSRLGGLFDKQRRDRELAGELESNLQLHIDENIRAGMTPEVEATAYGGFLLIYTLCLVDSLSGYSWLSGISG